MSVSLTESAARQIKKQLEKRGQGVGLKLGVKKSGCSGYAYTLDYSDAIEKDDEVYEEFGVKVIVQKNDLPFPFESGCRQTPITPRRFAKCVKMRADER